MSRKKLFSLFPKRAVPGGHPGLSFAGLWLFVHLAIPLLLLLSVFFIGQVRINTSLFDMLPRSSQSRAVMEADTMLGEKSGRELVIFAAAPDFEKAKKGAALLCAEFEGSPDFEDIVLYFDSDLMAELSRYLYDYRFVIAGKETLALLENGRAAEIAEDALARAFGAFTFIPLTNIENDPFLLAERRMGEFLSSSLLAGGSLSIKEDVLSAQKDGTWYVLLRLTLAPQAASLRSGRNAVGKIYAAASSIRESVPETEFYFSGIPFHSYESASGAQREISLISTITIIIILIMFLYAFRSLLPVFFSILAAGVSLGIAAAAALLVFREIHIITFVFGTTLIGTCVDYSAHFFVHWKGNPALKNGAEIRSHISKSVIMSFVSTEICFCVFLFAPFPILKQFAVFSMAGLLSSFLTCFCIYPLLNMPETNKRRFRLFEGKIFLRLKNLSLPQAARPALVIALALAALILLVFNFSAIKIENNISSLYTMSAALLESEKRAARVLDYGSTGWYFIVAGSSPEETLQNEERLAARLEAEVLRGNLGSFLGTSVFVPSIKKQNKTYNAMKALLPLAPAQFEYLGFPPQYAEAFDKEFAAARYCLPADAPPRSGISKLWIGEKNGNCYSCVLPLKPADEAVFRAIAGEIDSVYFVNKAKDIGGDLDTLTRTILLFFLAAYLAISVVICVAYPRRDSLKICAVPPLLVLSALALLAVNKIPLGFFSAAALVLVFGLGLDYIFYMTGKKHGKGRSLTSLAVVLSFLTTLLSFGALVLSSFTPAHIFGLTVSAGLGAAFMFAMLLQSAEP
ncbi:MAG: MMPL family transporter [Spirochaetaceae bacterium]|jgi:predicted exporter|nr:MMPL family transporter [Spirochaetaceae bacterium]